MSHSLYAHCDGCGRCLVLNESLEQLDLTKHMFDLELVTHLDQVAKSLNLTTHSHQDGGGSHEPAQVKWDRCDSSTPAGQYPIMLVRVRWVVSLKLNQVS